MLIFLAVSLAEGRAQTTALTAMRNGDAAKGWQAVGRLMLGKRGFCTAVLIAPRLVLTAAHCLFDKDTGARVPDELIRFQAGWRNGRAEAYRDLRRVALPPDYIYAGAEALERVGQDLALIELAQPILLPQVAPFALGLPPEAAMPVTVVSYGEDRAEMASIERDCPVLIAEAQLLILDCDIDFGSSGAPVFTLGAAGPEVVAVISAKAEYQGKRVALAVPLGGLLDDLQTDLSAGADQTGVGMLSGGMAVATSGGAGTGSGIDAGAKFIRP